MKFLCPSCKAKYQIADDKVAGRSVRMKCRKCGYVIQVSSIAGMGDALPGSDPPAPIDAMSDVSAAPPPANPLPAPNPTGAAEPSSPLAAAPASARATAPGRPPSPAVPPRTQGSRAGAGAAEAAPVPVAARPGSRPEAPSSLEAKKPVAPLRPSVPKPTFAANAKASLPGPKAPTVKSSLPRPAAPIASTTTAISSSAESAPEVTNAVRPARTAASSALPPVAPKPVVAKAESAPAAAARTIPDPFDDESTHIADAGALAGAFSLAVGGANEAPATDTLSMPGDEWFVGINGVPVGPIRLSELRSKAASGSVDRESLVWRDGFEDWRPLGTFPELVAIVDESLSSARASLTPFTPSVAGTVGPAAVVTDPFAAGGFGASATAKDLTAHSSAEAYRTSGVTGAAVVTDELAAAGIPRRAGTSPAAWIAIVMAVLFGLTIGFVLFKSQGKTVEIVKYVDRPVPGASGGVALAAQPSAAPDETMAQSDTKNPTKHLGSATKPIASSSPSEPEKNGGLKGLQGLTPLGPGRGPDSGSGPSGTVSGSGQLDGAQIQSTVARYTGSVKRACWQPALDTRDKDAPTTARVLVAITVLPSGSVQAANVNGGDPRGYRGLSQCISSRVRGWQFPPSGDTTTVNVPFVFAAQ